eukprot:2838306-Alexandrium_andersonii.AAC.1
MAADIVLRHAFVRVNVLVHVFDRDRQTILFAQDRGEVKTDVTREWADRPSKVTNSWPTDQRCQT